MSTPEHTSSSDPNRTQIDADASAGWREEYSVLSCPTSIEPEHAIAMTREDRPVRYRKKHRMGVTS